MKFHELLKPCRNMDNPRQNVVRVGECPDCGEVHPFVTEQSFLKKIDAYTLGWKAKKDEMRQKHYKDLIQPVKDGRPNPEFKKAYGKYPHEK